MFIDLCLRFRKSILAAWLAVVVFFGASLLHRLIPGKNLVDNSVGVWFMKTDPDLAEYEEYNKRFGEKEWSVLLLETGSIYDPAFLAELDGITRRIEALAPIHRVNSITNVRDNEVGGEDGLVYSRLYAPGANGAPAEAAAIGALKRRLAANPVFAGSLFRPGDERTTMVLFQGDNPLNDIEPFRLRLVDSVRAIVGGARTVKAFSLAGNTVVNAELNRSSQRDVIVFYSLITLLMTAFGWLTLRNFRDLSLIFITVLGSVLPTMGTLALLKIPFNMVTVMLPTILIALIIPDVVHAVHDFHRLRGKGMDSEAAMRESTRLLWMPSFWKSATDIVGFISFAPSSVVPIAQLGIYASLGIALGWLVTVTAVPLLLPLFWPDGSVRAARGAKDPASAAAVSAHKEWFRMPADYLAFLGRHKLAVGAGFLLLLSPLTGLHRVKIDTNYTRFFGDDAHITRSYAGLKGAGYGQSPIILTLRYPEGGGFATESGYRDAARLQTALQGMPAIRKLLSPTELLAQVDKAFNGDSAARGADGSGAAAAGAMAGYDAAKLGQLLLLAELSGNDDLSDLVSEDKTAIQMIALTDYMSSKELEDFKREVTAAASRILPQAVDFGITGTAVLWANMDKQVSRTQVFSLLSAGLLLGAVFFIFLRSFRLGVVGMFVNAVPIVATLGIMGWLGISINIATALIAGIAMGIVVDNSLHFINRFQGFQKSGKPWRDSINATISELGESMLMSGLIIIGSFLCMATSDFTPSREFGILVSLNILISLFLDFAVLPVLVFWVKPGKDGGSIRASERAETAAPLIESQSN